MEGTSQPRSFSCAHSESLTSFFSCLRQAVRVSTPFCALFLIPPFSCYLTPFFTSANVHRQWGWAPWIWAKTRNLETMPLLLAHLLWKCSRSRAPCARWKWRAAGVCFAQKRKDSCMLHVIALLPSQRQTFTSNMLAWNKVVVDSFRCDAHSSALSLSWPLLLCGV